MSTAAAAQSFAALIWGFSVVQTASPRVSIALLRSSSDKTRATHPENRPIQSKEGRKIIMSRNNKAVNSREEKG